MVKRKGNLISSLCRMDNILLADTNARKAKRRSRRFIEKHDKNIIEIETILEGMKMMVSWMCLILEAIGLVTGSETLA